MIYFNSISPRHFSSNGIFATVKSVVSLKALMGLKRRIKAHKEMQKLMRLDNHMLKDIGLYRSDLDWALQQSDRMDPLAALAQRRDESLHKENLATVQTYCKSVKELH
jgi:uncharacterized protein YjiS (DUF1127 family)